MSKPYTEEVLSDILDQDRTWRIKEISDLKTAALRADRILQKVLLRALIPICYAHWEGYVRFSARKYLEYVAIRKLQFGNLDRQFLRNHFLPRLAALSSSKSNIFDRCNLIDEILNSTDIRFSKVNEDIVSTKANLKSEVLCEICLICGISFDRFADKKTFIDVFLLKRRNAIAHGEDVMIDVSDLNVLTNETISLMRLFSDALEDNAYQGRYKLAC
ncbi:MAE_28990/MAE_18760 family HEPN-like nuclease [Chromobacterium vaccinii]|uniref:MAE_28990/MAE_18760 family HEPN-like nuclease n=1 Tax=Chromobacterium vaccinii TaxID=1108595 RepID=UPI0009F569C5|nr:MAE_28990/MAE_18760 family HEPN-like nuclease [Chromobacterium vaccinii]